MAGPLGLGRPVGRIQVVRKEVVAILLAAVVNELNVNNCEKAGKA
jgi:hypothetical protein